MYIKILLYDSRKENNFTYFYDLYLSFQFHFLLGNYILVNYILGNYILGNYIIKQG